MFSGSLTRLCRGHVGCWDLTVYSERKFSIRRKFTSAQMLMSDFCFSAEYFIFVSVKIFDTKNPFL